MSEELLKEKWDKFHKRVKVFNSIPFVDFVLAAGSMAMGTAKETSDFDVIIGVKKGRIFTLRFFSVLFLGIRGWRTTASENMEDKSKSADKICLNHFVTPESYKLSPPYNNYWKALYESLIPMLGDKEAIKEFFTANDWVDQEKTKNKHENVLLIKKTLMGNFLSFILSGKFGDIVERLLKNIQVKKIERNLNNGYTHKPRIIYSDSELEFHPNTERIEAYLDR